MHTRRDFEKGSGVPGKYWIVNTCFSSEERTPLIARQISIIIIIVKVGLQRLEILLFLQQ